MDPIEKYINSITNHTPSSAGIARIEHFRAAFRELAGALDQLPPGRETSLVYTNIEQAVMWGVKAIILDDQAQNPK